MACNGRQFNSIEDDVCQLVYVERAEVLKSEDVSMKTSWVSGEMLPVGIRLNIKMFEEISRKAFLWRLGGETSWREKQNVEGPDNSSGGSFKLREC